MRVLSNSAERSAIAERVRALLDVGEPPGDRRPASEPVPVPALPALPSTGPTSVPQRQHRARVDPGRRSAAAVGVVALVVAVICIWWVSNDRPQSLAVSTRTVSAAASTAVSSATAMTSNLPASLSSPPIPTGSSAPMPSAPSNLVVDVAGRVRHQGVYRLPPGSRVNDAIKAAGGALPGVDLSGLNLASLVADGQQIAVGVPGAGSAPPVASTAASASGAGLVDLNTASAEQLDTLPGVGPVLAKNIVEWRTAHGRFDTIDQLREVTGIGPAKFATLKGAVTV
ncbi:competence protein ComEA [Jatrophihabitans sp. GAS493]|uniref:ComEA family DNA-binding protein n=1 Tax=Jatrophihabitans sp. GAS493 TaxID=1907575 RepID=UPI000BC02C02|nr:ComEA family DNA-binding protein [Jatrophihabitans sp. GAS493]SOD74733.1 competence protein ComEA [Jatrophihabitans sp. GAS493]